MTRYQPLLINDLRKILRDPMLMGSLLGPLLIIAIVRFLFPFATDWIEHRSSIRIADYNDFVITFLLIAAQLLLGAMSGLLMLDERDENVIAYYCVTPLARKGYMSYRLSVPSIISACSSTLFILLSGITQLSTESIFMIVLLIVEAPMIALFLAVFADNKVEGLALSKICGLLLAGPILVEFAPASWHFLGVWLPTFWSTIAYTTHLSNEPIAGVTYFVTGMFYHLLLLMWLVRAFHKRID